MTLAQYAKLTFLVLDLAGQLLRWIEREGLRSEAERELFREQVRRHNEAVFAAKELRARVRAELDALTPEQLRQHKDAHLRD